ncbi:MAG: acyl carrier protein [Bacteroidaceae bacterium]|nr:acyl carrier protein [Bacteroidaceae bacterium]
MNRTEIEKKIREFMIEELEIEEEKLHEEALLKDDLGIDSLDYVDIVVIVDKIFGFRIKPEEMSSVKTYGDFCNYIENKL